MMHLKKIKVDEMQGVMPNPMSWPPSFSINAKQMPEIKDWEVGKKYRLVIEVEQKSKNEREDSLDASFEIVAYKHLKEKTMDEMSDSEFGEYQGQVMERGHL